MYVTEFLPSEDEEYEPTFDFSIPEDVILEVIEEPRCFRSGWKKFSIDYVTVAYGDDHKEGAASYESSYSGFLDYTLEGIVDEPTREGIFVIEDVTATYHRGDGWTTDDSMDFYCGDMRPATMEEILSVWCGGTDFWASEPENVA